MSGRNSAPTGYDEIVQVLESLPGLVLEKRRRDRLSLREAARQMGVSFSTIHRLEIGEDLVLSNAVTALRWVAGSLDRTAGQALDRELAHAPDSLAVDGGAS